VTLRLVMSCVPKVLLEYSMKLNCLDEACQLSSKVVIMVNVVHL